jgi:hypothetical protein
MNLDAPWANPNARGRRQVLRLQPLNWEAMIVKCTTIARGEGESP